MDRFERYKEIEKLKKQKGFFDARVIVETVKHLLAIVEEQEKRIQILEKINGGV